MAAGPWQIYTKAKRYIGGASATAINLAGVFRMCLVTAAGSDHVLKITNTGISAWNSLSAYEISARGGYVANGRSVPNVMWTVGASTKQMQFDFTATGLIFTASDSSLINIKYAVIRNSTGAGVGRVLCYCTLSASQFTITSPNTLTILPAATGVFTLA